MPKKLKYQYSVSVSFLEKSVKKQANQADLKNGVAEGVASDSHDTIIQYSSD